MARFSVSNSNQYNGAYSCLVSIIETSVYRTLGRLDKVTELKYIINRTALYAVAVTKIKENGKNYYKNRIK